MFVSETKIRVRYAETDQMGYVYYGNYATYLEVARVETMRDLGVSYKSLEDKGIMMPVLDLNVKYIKPVLYDDLITVKTIIKELPKSRIKFEYEIYRENGDLTTLCSTTLVFVDAQKMKPTLPPDDIMEALAIFFES